MAGASGASETSRAAPGLGSAPQIAISLLSHPQRNFARPEAQGPGGEQPKAAPLHGMGMSKAVAENKPSAAQPRLMWLGLHVLGLLFLWSEGAWPDGWGFTVVVVATLLFYSAASFTDPGFVNKPVTSELDSTLAASLLDQPICVFCQQGIPKRAKHCFTCCRCVHRLDHHCIWLGNCVGELNHRVFIAYLFAQGILLGWAAVASGTTLLTGRIDDRGNGAALRKPLSLWGCLAGIGCCGLSALLFLAVATLFGFQVMLVLRGETTSEHLRRAKINEAAQLPPHMRPYDQGPCRNVLTFCHCAEDSASQLRKRQVSIRPAEEDLIAESPSCQSLASNGSP
ncbi:MAG: hypothetical protein SGPRY_007819 [Prymnesium sp.]